jgi:hypothetical protein
MRLMLLEQQEKKRLLMAQKEQDSMPRPFGTKPETGPSSSNTDPSTMPSEQCRQVPVQMERNKGRSRMARERRDDMVLPAGHASSTTQSQPDGQRHPYVNSGGWQYDPEGRVNIDRWPTPNDPTVCDGKLLHMHARL